MSEAGATAAHDAHAEHHELGFIRTYIFSTDHKMIGRQFIFASILMLIVGGLLAMMMRWELAWRRPRCLLPVGYPSPLCILRTRTARLAQLRA